MKTEIRKNDFQINKYICCGKKYMYEKETWFCKNDSNSESISSKPEIENVKFDFPIPDFFNDKPKIYCKYRTITPLIPEWYKNLNNYDNIDLKNNNIEDEFIFN